MEEKHNYRQALLAFTGFFCLGLGIAVAGYFVGNMMFKVRVATKYATVKGLAEREVKADIGIWNVTFEVSGSTLPEAYEAADEAQKKVAAFLTEKGFAETGITRNAFSVSQNDKTNDEGKVIGTTYKISGGISVRSEDVDKVAAAAQQAGGLIGQGVILTNASPQYLFTKLNEIKPEMLGEATKNARIAAQQFAQDAQAEVGSIFSAEQGAFNFSGRDDTSEYSENEAASIYKKVRVVTTISFYLKD